MIFLVPSVHHTGTKTICNSLLKDYEGINQQDPNPPEVGKIRIHIDEAFLSDLDRWLDRAISIVPLRHPRSVAQGWKNRVKPLKLLGEQWTWLKDLVAPRVNYFVPIDLAEDRDKVVENINKDLGLKLSTSWPVLGHHEGEEIPLTDDDEREIETWMKDGFFDQFNYKF